LLKLPFELELFKTNKKSAKLFRRNKNIETNTFLSILKFRTR
jgi:hypothetical protein